MKALDAQTAALAPGSYHDFSGLTALKGKAKEAGQGEAALRAAAQQFEAMFVQEMMRTMRQAGIKADLMESHALETFEGMFDKEVSVQMARRGSFGMADMLVQQMKRHLPQPVAPGTDGPAGAALEGEEEGAAEAAVPGGVSQPSAADVLRARESAGLPLQRPARAHSLRPIDETPAGHSLPTPKFHPLPGRNADGTKAD